MGANFTQEVLDLVNQTTTNVLMKNMSTCKASSTMNQNVDITGSSWFSWFEQSSSIDMTCLGKFQMNDSIVNQIANEIQQQAINKSIALMNIGQVNGTDIETNLKNIITTNITTEMIQNSLASLKMNQNIVVSGSATGVTVSQSSDMIQKAIMQGVSSTNLANTILNQTKQTSDNELANPLAIFGSFAFIFIIIIIIIIGAGAYFLFEYNVI